MIRRKSCCTSNPCPANDILFPLGTPIPKLPTPIPQHRLHLRDTHICVAQCAGVEIFIFPRLLLIMNLTLIVVEFH
jgi:hypothetical protein